jgi:hypothetical protein
MSNGKEGKMKLSIPQKGRTGGAPIGMSSLKEGAM